MTRRLAALGVLFGVEAFVGALATRLGSRAEGTLCWVAGVGILFAIVLYVRPLAEESRALPAPRLVWLALHGVAAGLLFSAANIASLIAAGLTAVAAGLLAAVSWNSVREALRRAGRHAIWAAAGSTVACALFVLGARLETPATHLTYAMVRLALSRVSSGSVLHPEQMSVGTSRFSVTLLPGCSGILGMGILVCLFFCWAIVFYDQIRIWRALALLPAALLLQYLMNALRIVAMVLIGQAGAPNVASAGFHENAGWITVLATALVFLAVSPVAGVYKKRSAPCHTGNTIAPYVTPFLAILAAGLIAGAMSNGFEWAYALRVIAAAAVLWKFRSRYREIDFRSGWIGPLIGAAVFALWAAADASMGNKPTGTPQALTHSAGALSATWILFRIAGAVITVPVAEELAFRGLLLRRLLGRRLAAPFFERVPYTALAVSSVIFGVLHGGPWLAATAAGLLYGLATCWKGRLGEPIAAHATTNALLAGYVLMSGRWNLW